jgi:hypothetical protein
VAYRMEEKNGPVPQEPGPSFPIPIPWIPTEPSSVLRPVRGPTARLR